MASAPRHAPLDLGAPSRRPVVPFARRAWTAKTSERREPPTVGVNSRRGASGRPRSVGCDNRVEPQDRGVELNAIESVGGDRGDVVDA